MVDGIWSFDGTERAAGTLVEPSRYQQLYSILKSSPSVIPRGAGLSYCNAAAGDRVVSVSSRQFNRVTAFDQKNGVVEVEPGITVGSLTQLALRFGWIPPVLPGHPAITVGGCVGFNVHGKSQRESGNFVRCIQSLDVFHPDHGLVTCSPTENSKLFEVTVGGFGLTGFVTSIRIKLEPSVGRSLIRESIPVQDLHEAVATMESCENPVAVYSWHDLTAARRTFGPGIVYVERSDEEDAEWRSEFRSLTAESRRRYPLCIFNRITTPMINLGYGWMGRLGGATKRLPMESALFPISGKEFYFRMFGRRGLREYQALVPRSAWQHFAAELRGMLRKHRATPSLGSLKLFTGDSSYLNFCGSGVCLALDVPATPSAPRLFADIDRLAIEVSGIVNLSKDSRITSDTVQRMFPGYGAFADFIQDFDPHRKFWSSLGDRIFG